LLFRDILIITESLPPVYGGADIAAYRYFKFLQNAEKKVVLLGTHNANLKKEPNIFSIRTIAVNGIFKRWGGYYFAFLFLFIQVLVFLLARPRLRIIHAFNAATLIIQVTVLAAKLSNRKVILETSLMGSDDPTTLINNRGGMVHRIMSGKVIRKKLYLAAHAYVSKSKFLTKGFEQFHIKPVYEIPYAVDTQKYGVPTAARKNEIRKALGLPLDKYIISFVGGINKRKGVDLLLSAFHQVMIKRNDIFLVLVGPTEKYEQDFVKEIQRQVYEMGSDRALMAGQVEETKDWMMASDIYALPSWREGFPISIIEALCCGLLVIGSDIPEIKGSQLQHEENGLVFETGSIDDLICKLEQAIEIIESGANFTKASRAKAIEKYNIRTIANQYDAVYKQLEPTYE